MSEQPTNHVLLIGGHLDGQWADVPARDRRHRVMKPMRIHAVSLIDTNDTSIPVPELVDYVLERIPIRIRDAAADLWIATPTTLHGPERDLAIVRAIFQRDVAQQFKETW